MIFCERCREIRLIADMDGGLCRTCWATIEEEESDLFADEAMDGIDMTPLSEDDIHRDSHNAPY